jgi:hypothetical protein
MIWRTNPTQAFADALDGRRPAEGELAELVAVATRLCEIAADTEPSPEFRSALRTRLLATPMPAPSPAAIASRPTRSPSGVRRVTVAFAALLATTFGAGLSVASADTIPGDTLYPVKRALEATQLAFKRSDSSSGNFHLHLATERLTEVDQLTNGTSGNLTTETLAEFQRQASLGSDELMRSYLSNDSRGDLAALNHFSASSTHQLADLRGRLSVADLEKTQELLDGLVVQSTRMCPDCSGSVAADSPSEPEPTAAEPIEVPTSRSIAPADGARVRHEVSSPPTIASPTPSASVSADATQIPTESPNMDSVETPPVAELMQKSAEAPAKPSADLGIVKKLTEQSDKLLKLPGSDNN